MPRWLHWPDTILYNTFVYCAFSVDELRPIDPVNGTFVYCAFDLNNSGFDRTP